MAKCIHKKSVLYSQQFDILLIIHYYTDFKDIFVTYFLENNGENLISASSLFDYECMIDLGEL